MPEMRVESRTLVSSGRAPRKRILLTGATGNVGALTAARLLQRGDTVYCIVRSRRRNRERGRGRVLRAFHTLLGRAAPEGAALDRLHVIEGDFTRPEIRDIEIPEPIDGSWLIASSLKFLPKHSEEIYAANVTGLEHLLALHERVAVPGAPAHYISTAYVGGRSTRVVPETPIPMDEKLAFNNEYERSKLLAERTLLRVTQAGAVHGVIFRPSVVVGMSRSGRLVNYNGYYLGLQAWRSLSDYAAAQGRAGEVVRVWLEEHRQLNLIPLDSAVDAMLKIASGSPAPGRIYNIVNEQPLTLARIFERLAPHLAVQPQLCGSAESRPTKTIFEKLVGYGLTYTAPYIKQDVAFETGNTRQALGGALAVNLYPRLLDRFHEVYFRRAAREARRREARQRVERTA